VPIVGGWDFSKTGAGLLGGILSPFWQGNALEAQITQKKATPDALDIWIEHLAKHEGCSPTGTPDMGSLSYGDLCFKKGTFVGFVKQFNLLPQCEGDEVMNWIGDGQFQRKLAKMMIEDKYSNWQHWRTTVKKIGLPPKV